VITLRKNIRVGSFFIFFLNTVLRANCYDFDFSAFQTVTKHISGKVDVRLVKEFCLNLVHLLYRLLETKGKRKSEVSDLVFWVCKVVRKLKEEHLAFCIRILLEPKGRFGNQSSPFFLLSWQNTKYWFQSLAVQFALQTL